MTTSFSRRRFLVRGVGIFTGLAASLYLAPSHGQEADTARQKRRWRVMIVVQETHIARPRIPDPAVETELSRQVIDAGYKVIDTERYAALRYDAQISRLIKGGNGSEMLAAKLGRRFGADIIVVGEAFTMVHQSRQVESDLGMTPSIQCRARVELKAIRVDTAEKFWSDALHKTGSGEPTEELSSKKALQEAAEDIAEKLLVRLDKLALATTRQIELDVRGVASATVSSDLQDALAQIPGVVDVSPGDLEAQTLHLEIEVEKSAVKGLTRLLENHAAMKPFKLKVLKNSGSKIIADID